jgi:hypothetical protein
MRRRDIDEALRGWPSDPNPSGLAVREISARNGRTLLQIRVELGILQLEVQGRPDGTRPHGFPTYLDYLRFRAREYELDRRSARRRPRDLDWASVSGPDWDESEEAGKGIAGLDSESEPLFDPLPPPEVDSTRSAQAHDRWTMNRDHHRQVDREFLQFYHRRIAWLALRRYDQALRDAEHSLALMDFVTRHSAPEMPPLHERFRPLVLFHRAQAAAALALEEHRPDDALDALAEGMQRIEEHRLRFQGSPLGLLGDEEDLAMPPGLAVAGSEDALSLPLSTSESGDELDDTLSELGEGEVVSSRSLVAQLRKLDAEIRHAFEVPRTLLEQLQDAVAREDYETAAVLRDQIKARSDRR